MPEEETAESYYYDSYCVSNVIDMLD